MQASAQYPLSPRRREISGDLPPPVSSSWGQRGVTLNHLFGLSPHGTVPRDEIRKTPPFTLTTVPGQVLAVMAHSGVVFVWSRHAHLDRLNGSVFMHALASSWFQNAQDFPSSAGRRCGIYEGPVVKPVGADFIAQKVFCEHPLHRRRRSICPGTDPSLQARVQASAQHPLSPRRREISGDLPPPVSSSWGQRGVTLNHLFGLSPHGTVP